MPENTHTTVHVVDDNEAIRDALSILLESIGLHCICHEHAQAFLEAEVDKHQGCAIVDIRMPGMSGLKLQDVMNEQGYTLPIIFLSGHGDIPMAVEAMKKGAIEFIPKPFREQQLLDCIQTALEQNQEQRGKALEQRTIQDRIARLSGREREVLEKIVKGDANKVIAINLNLSQRTVEIHRAHVMEKMEARSLADLVKMVMLAETGHVSQ